MLAYYYGYYDPTYFLVIIAAIIALIAQAKVSSSYNRYSKLSTYAGMTGSMVAERILRANGIYDVSIECVSGKLTDHYDPARKVLRLSSSVYNDSSIASVAVAAHECGHAIQHARQYSPLTIRSTIAPIASISSSVSWILILLGLFINGQSGMALLNIGIIVFTVVVAFQLITLPVEFNASKRALVILENDRFLQEEELKGAKKMLSAAALTYVAAAATAILQLLRLIIISGGRNRD